MRVGQSLVVPTRSTQGTLVPGNHAQCKAIVSESDTSFVVGTNVTIVPGQYALGAIDGSNATTWQPLSDSTSSFTVDLGSVQSIKRLHFNWGSNPALSYTVSAGKSASKLVPISSGNVNISAPYDASDANAVKIRVGNLTDVLLSQTVQAQYLSVAINGSYRGDGRGGTLAEFAVV